MDNSLIPLVLLNKSNDPNLYSFTSIILILLTFIWSNPHKLKVFYKMILRMLTKKNIDYQYNLSFKCMEVIPDYSNGKIHMAGSKKIEALIWFLSEEIKKKNIQGLEGLREYDGQLNCRLDNECYNDRDDDSYDLDFELKVMPMYDCLLQLKSNSNIKIEWKRIWEDDDKSSSKEDRILRKTYILKLITPISDSYIMNWVEEICLSFKERERLSIKGKTFAFKLRGFKGHHFNPRPIVSVYDISNQSRQYEFEDQLIERDQKNKLNKLLDDFMDSSKKRMNDANTLGLFLYGPPGTGKSSLIKSICGKLPGYHLFITNPDLIETTNQLDSIFYFKDINGMPISSSKVIMVIEDIDRVNTNIFKTEDSDEKLYTSEIDEYDEIDKDDDKYNYRKNNRMTKRRYNNRSEFDFQDSNFKNSKVSKSDWFQALQGIIGGNEKKVVIMTGNNITCLDKALTRSGRIDKKIYMGPLDFYNLVQLIRNHFKDSYFKSDIESIEKLDIETKEKLDKKWKVSDAKSVCKQCNNIEVILDFLINKTPDDIEFIID